MQERADCTIDIFEFYVTCKYVTFFNPMYMLPAQIIVLMVIFNKIINVFVILLEIIKSQK